MQAFLTTSLFDTLGNVSPALAKPNPQLHPLFGCAQTARGDAAPTFDCPREVQDDHCIAQASFTCNSKDCVSRHALVNHKNQHVDMDIAKASES